MLTYYLELVVFIYACMHLLINGVYFINLHMHARYCLFVMFLKEVLLCSLRLKNTEIGSKTVIL